ncbi:MAG TPA: diadenylate cyclase CdaA [Candidatus Omnitrophota bacterium]|nr:diadenylate cyclase CdaA [Candidatus Omnitrophota bacterium]HPD85259.1 diadenylate cyclase CdaA [Candidatus Omnitrophota bacterium]HRZ04240.1 diadenylate cyclase CdaA [Candidatus Omnitrophota bacterium]
MHTIAIWDHFKILIEIAILWFTFYRVLIFFQGTRAFLVLKGIAYLLAVFLISQILGLATINWLMTKLFAISVIAILIIFQPELRQGLARLGQRNLFNTQLEESELAQMIEKISAAAHKMSQKKIGCLLAIERETKLQTYIESGIPTDSQISEELLQSIFTPPSPLHDGGVIIRGGRIASVSCLFPLCENPNLNKLVGMRHRAALGMSEQTDAIVVMVSEESGEISISTEGRFIPVVNHERFVSILHSLMRAESKKS